MDRRRALRGYVGRTETPPAKLSACATCHGAGARGERGRRGAGDHATHRTMRRGGAMGTSRPTATGHGNGTGRRDAGGAHDHGAMRRDGDIAPYRNGSVRRMDRNGTRVVRTATDARDTRRV